MLRELLLADASDPQPVVEDDGPRRCRALIDRNDIAAHWRSPPSAGHATSAALALNGSA
jgi:hypothetical protein